ncbi:MAG: GTPase Era [Solirubrobacteraceae bacterium]
MSTRSGFIALAGRPNVGKSTLVNAIVGCKVAIVSDKPQTTRRAIRGVATRTDGDAGWQAVLCDLPGVQRPRDVLTSRMQRRVEQEIAGCDGVLFLLDGAQGVGGPGDRFIAKALAEAAAPVTIVVNKADKLHRPGMVAALEAATALDAEFGLDAEIYPISGRKGTGVEALTARIVSLLPEGPFYFDVDEVSDLREDFRLAELVREQVLRRTRQEVPHAVEVQVEEISERGDVLFVQAAVWVETESQKGILIGAGGRMIRDVGTAARKEIEREVAERVHLELQVRVRRSWRADDALLDRLGIT